MSCRETHERLPDWLAGLLEPDEAQVLGSHLEACGECGAEADLLRAAREAFSPAALGEAAEPNWAAMSNRVLREARAQTEAPGLSDRLREWLAQAWSPPRLKPALVAAAVIVLSAMSFYITVGPYLFGPQRVKALATLSVEELEALSEALPVEGEADLLGPESVDAETLREISKLSPEELDRFLKTM